MMNRGHPAHQSRVPLSGERPKPTMASCHVCGCGVNTMLDGERATVERVNGVAHFVHRDCQTCRICGDPRTARAHTPCGISDPHYWYMSHTFEPVE